MTLIAGLVVAAAAWGFLFGPWRRGFWERAAVAGAAIGLYALVAQRDLLGDLLRPAPTDVAIGVVAAAVLYAIFWAGDRVLGVLVPGMAAEVHSLYAARASSGSRRLPVPAVLVLVGTCEELFWRGYVQDRTGLVAALVGYAAVHLWERKAVLVLAAVVGGAFWAVLFAWRDTLVAPIVSHALWDLAVVVWFPFRRPTRRS